MKKILSGTSVFVQGSRSGTISERFFYAILGITVIWGLYTTSLGANYAIAHPIEWKWWTFLLVGLGIPLIGIFVAQLSDTPITALIGYHLVTVPIGFTLAGALTRVHHPEVVYNAMLITGLVTGVMTLAAFARPSLFEGLGSALLASLLCLIAVRILQIFIPELAHLGIVDWISAGIFSLYIAYDITCMQSADRTFNNAIRGALSLYLDILNLFLSILSILDGDD